MKYTILFFGTPTFATTILKEIHKKHNVVGVVTQPDRPVGRKQILTAPAVKTLAQELGIPVFQPEKAANIIDSISERIDFIVTVAYGQYLPSKVLNLPFKDALNIHPSMLPKYRGATPMQSSLLNGEKKTGVSIIRMAKEMDAGPIFSQQQFQIPKEWKYPELEKKCSSVGAELLLNVIKNYHSMSPQEQEKKTVSSCTKIHKQNGNIYWKNETAQQIFNKLRAFTPWPGVYSFWKKQKLSLCDFSTTLDNNHRLAPGTLWEKDGHILVQTKKGSLKLFKIQLAGKVEMEIHSFINGHQDFIGSSLEYLSHTL